MNEIGVFVILTTENNEYFLGARREAVGSRYPVGVLELLGGGINSGEDMPAAAQREISEETRTPSMQEGFCLNPLRLKPLATNIGKYSTSYYFIYPLDLLEETQLRSIQNEIPCDDEHIKFMFMNIQQVYDLANATIEESGKGIRRPGVLILHADAIFVAEKYLHGVKIEPLIGPIASGDKDMDLMIEDSPNGFISIKYR